MHGPAQKIELSRSSHFFGRFSTWLRVNYPVFWLSRMHIVLPLALSLFLLTNTLGSVYPLELSNIPTSGTIGYFFMLTLAVLLALVFTYLRLLKQHNWSGASFAKRLFFLGLVLINVSATYFAVVGWVTPLYHRIAALEPAPVPNSADEFRIMSVDEAKKFRLLNEEYYSFRDSLSEAETRAISINHPQYLSKPHLSYLGDNFYQRSAIYGIQLEEKSAGDVVAALYQYEKRLTSFQQIKRISYGTLAPVFSFASPLLVFLFPILAIALGLYVSVLGIPARISSIKRKLYERHRPLSRSANQSKQGNYSPNRFLLTNFPSIWEMRILPISAALYGIPATSFLLLFISTRSGISVVGGIKIFEFVIILCLLALIVIVVHTIIVAWKTNRDVGIMGHFISLTAVFCYQFYAYIFPLDIVLSLNSLDKFFSLAQDSQALPQIIIEVNMLTLGLAIFLSCKRYFSNNRFSILFWLGILVLPGSIYLFLANDPVDQILLSGTRELLILDYWHIVMAMLLVCWVCYFYKLKITPWLVTISATAVLSLLLIDALNFLSSVVEPTILTALLFDILINPLNPYLQPLSFALFFALFTLPVVYLIRHVSFQPTKS